MIHVLLFLIVFLLLNWNIPFYRDRNRKKLVSDESKCFSDKCRSIVYDRGRKEAVLLIHGFPATPYMYKYASARLDEAGFDAYAPLIPTFGADIKEFENTDFTQWFDFISAYYESLRKRYEKVFVLGVSMGGAMTLKIGEKYSGTDMAPDAIVSISAPVAYNSIKCGVFTNLGAVLAPTLSLFVKNIGAGTVTSRPYSDDGDEEWTGYKGTFIRQGLSLSKAFDQIRKDLKKIAVPMYVMHDRGDKTVPFKNLAVLEKSCHDYIKVKREVEMKGDFHHTHHCLLSYRSVQKEYMDDIISFLKGGYDSEEKGLHKLG